MADPEPDPEPDPDPEIDQVFEAFRPVETLNGFESLRVEGYQPLPAPPAAEPPPWEAEQISAEVDDWLHCHAGSDQSLQLGLVCVPEAGPVSRDSSRLELNLWPFLGTADPQRLEDVMAAFLAPVRVRETSGRAAQLGVRDSIVSLYESMGHLWRVGEQLPQELFFRINQALPIWSRLTGPGSLGARLLPSGLPVPRFDSHDLLVQLDAVELAALQGVLYEREQLEPALARLRREHLNVAFWNQRSPDWWFRPADPVENLKRLHTDCGFYAAAGADMACLVRWADGVFRCLAGAALWSSDGTTASFFLPVAQALCSETGGVPELTGRPDLLEIYRVMAGQEVLYVGPHSEAILNQHRSGRAFRLFLDRTIAPYGLRAVPAPESHYPQRPDRGFSASLDGLIKQVVGEFQRKPFGLLLADCGAYRLPLLDELRARCGVRGVAMGAATTALFGVDLPEVPRWRAENRQADQWMALGAEPWRRKPPFSRASRGVGRPSAGVTGVRRWSCRREREICWAAWLPGIPTALASCTASTGNS